MTYTGQVPAVPVRFFRFGHYNVNVMSLYCFGICILPRWLVS